MFKKATIYILPFLMLGLLNAKTLTLEEKIAKLSTVPKEQRYILINSIKRDLIRLNQAERLKAINKLRAKLNGNKMRLKGTNRTKSRLRKGLNKHITHKNKKQAHKNRQNKYNKHKK